MPTVKGWTCAKIISQVMGRTENRASNKPLFDTDFEFFTALDEFCLEKHFWWRRKYASLAVQAGKQTYDLGAAVTAGGAGAPDVQEIEEMFVVTGLPTSYPGRVNPRFTSRQQLAAIFGAQNVNQEISRTGFFIDPNTFQQLTFTAPPPTSQTVAFTYWAIPMITDTAAARQNPPPLVPPWLHWGLIYMFERRIYEYLYGQNDPRWTVSNQRYQEFIVKAAHSKDFSTQEAIHSTMQYPSVVASGGRAWPRQFSR